jgi:hypothetical protein
MRASFKVNLRLRLKMRSVTSDVTAKRYFGGIGEQMDKSNISIKLKILGNASDTSSQNDAEIEQFISRFALRPSASSLKAESAEPKTVETLKNIIIHHAQKGSGVKYRRVRRSRIFKRGASAFGIKSRTGPGRCFTP